MPFCIFAAKGMAREKMSSNNMDKMSGPCKHIGSFLIIESSGQQWLDKQLKLNSRPSIPLETSCYSLRCHASRFRNGNRKTWKCKAITAESIRSNCTESGADARRGYNSLYHTSFRPCSHYQ
jgi:hypothetical protein